MLEHNRQIAADIARELAHEFGLETDNHWEGPVVRHIAEDLERMSYTEAHALWRKRLGVAAKVVNHA
jgi:hypothetical protein